MLTSGIAKILLILGYRVSKEKVQIKLINFNPRNSAITVIIAQSQRPYSTTSMVHIPWVETTSIVNARAALHRMLAYFPSLRTMI